MISSRAFLWFVALGLGVTLSTRGYSQKPPPSQEKTTRYDDLPADLRKTLDNGIGLGVLRGAYKAMFEKCEVTDEIEKEFFYSGMMNSFGQEEPQCVTVYLVKASKLRGPVREIVAKDKRERIIFQYRSVNMNVETPFAIISCCRVKDGVPVAQDRLVYYEPKRPWGIARDKMEAIKRQMEK